MRLLNTGLIALWVIKFRVVERHGIWLCLCFSVGQEAIAKKIEAIENYFPTFTIAIHLDQVIVKRK